MDMTIPERKKIQSRLRDPFDPADVDFRIQGKRNDTTGKVQVLAYIDARTVQDRLDDVVGISNWSFDWEPTVIEKGEVLVAKGTLTIYGVSKSDAGSASNFEQSMGAVSHCFKRAAVMWGIGRYLYDIEKTWVAVNAGITSLSPAMVADLRKRLPRPKTVTTDDDAYLPHSRQDAIVDDAWNDLDHRRERLGVSDSDWGAAKKAYTTVAKMAAALDRVEKRRWEGLRMRANEVGMAAAEYDELLQETGGDYQEMQARVEAFSQRDLRMLKGGKAGVH